MVTTVAELLRQKGIRTEDTLYGLNSRELNEFPITAGNFFRLEQEKRWRGGSWLWEDCARRCREKEKNPTYQELEACFGSPKALASKLYAESAVKASGEKKPGNTGKALVIGLAALFSLPVTFPLALVILMALFVILVLILAVVFSIGATVVALGGAFVSLAAESWGYLLSFAPGLWLKFLGGALIILAAIILMISLILFAARHILGWISRGIARIAERRTKDE